jgi:glucose-6-phosphate isomerase
MLTKNIELKNFKKIKYIKEVKNTVFDLKKLIQSNLDLFLFSLTNKYKNNFNNNDLKKFKKFNKYTLVGMGGSSLGAKAIYSFLRHKIKKKFEFIDNLRINRKLEKDKKNLNIIISKSGNTLETVLNFNSLKKKNSIFITQEKNNFLRDIANELKSEIYKHQNYIGGRYSVLSETGMLPAALMGLNIKNFKQLNSIINNKNFVNQLVTNVSCILEFYKNKKTNSIILNYDENSKDLFYWYQQLVAESLGKKSKGILPIVSAMPKDNHSLMQLYLDGTKNNFFTFFMVEEKISNKINKKYLPEEYSFLHNKKSFDILKAQFQATQNIFKIKKIPFRSFVIKKRDEKVLGELFCFFILETILLGKALRLNPFDQPEVELIKKETNKILKSNFQK